MISKNLYYTFRREKEIFLGRKGLETFLISLKGSLTSSPNVMGVIVLCKETRRVSSIIDGYIPYYQSIRVHLMFMLLPHRGMYERSYGGLMGGRDRA